MVLAYAKRKYKIKIITCQAEDLNVKFIEFRVKAFTYLLLPKALLKNIYSQFYHQTARDHGVLLLLYKVTVQPEILLTHY